MKRNTQYAFTIPDFSNYAVAGDWLYILKTLRDKMNHVGRQKMLPYNQVNIKVVHECKTKPMHNPQDKQIIWRGPICRNFATKEAICNSSHRTLQLN